MAEEVKILPCKDKMIFATKKEAANIALAADWQHGSALKPYHCSYCKLWHLTTD